VGEGGVAANTLNKQSRTADKGSCSNWRLGEGLTTFHRDIQKVAQPDSLRKRIGRTWSGFIWLRIRPNGGLL